MIKLFRSETKSFLKPLINLSLQAHRIVELTEEQKEMLQLSEADIKYGRLISQDEMNKRNLEWLNEK